MRKYKITASIIGPYFPVDYVQLGAFTIRRVQNKVSNRIPTRIQVNSVNENLVAISQDIIFDSNYIVEWEKQATSSKAAYHEAKIELEELLACINLPASSYKYFAKIVTVEHLNEAESGPDPESPSSDPVHVIGYIPGEFLKENVDFYNFLLDVKDTDMKEMLSSFYVGIKGEILGQGTPDLIYYKILEKISLQVLKSSRTDQTTHPHYSSVLNELKNILVKDSSEKQKVIKVKEYANKLRALDFEQIGERIILAAREFNLRPEIIDMLKKINSYRAKVLAHPGKLDANTKLDDPRDLREMARIFLLHYLNKFYELKIPAYNEIIEKNNWYMYTFSRSDAKGSELAESTLEKGKK